MPIKLLPMRASSEVRAEQIKLLYHQGTTIQLLGIATAIVSIAMFWRVVDHVLLSSWFVAHLAISIARLLATIKFNSSHISADDQLERWGKAYVLGTFMSGVVWGLLSFFFEATWPVPYQVMLFVIYTGITAGAYNTNSSLFIAFPAFYLPPTICLTYVTLNQVGDGFLELSALFMIYIVLMYVSALKYHNHLTRSLEIRFENKRLAEQLAASNQNLLQLVDLDELTCIANRRAMDRQLQNEWNRHYRVNKPLSLLFIDIDFFKQYNDSYGHDRGDQCLIEVARILQNHAQRSNDMAARFGGEEFAVILPETPQESARKIAENIQNTLADLRLPHKNSQVSQQVTMSIGLVTMIPTQPDHAELLRLAADKALYQAKRQGRNQIALAEPS